MISFPPCKINLGLNIVSRRDDGFHNIETCFYPVPWCDILEIVPSEQTSLHISGIPVPGDVENNIVLKAHRLLKRDFDVRPVEIYLHKVIPHGAGLGGGSSDGAYALKIISTLYELNIHEAKLKEYALELGSDVPFFIDSSPVIAKGRGEVLSNAKIDLSGHWIAIVKPEVSVSTMAAYANIKPSEPKIALEQAISKPVAEWKNCLKNDFEEWAVKTHPIIGEIKNKFYEFGAEYASMSGSGSAVFGLFKQPIDLESEFLSMKFWSGRL